MAAPPVVGGKHGPTKPFQTPIPTKPNPKHPGLYYVGKKKKLKPPPQRGGARQPAVPADVQTAKVTARRANLDRGALPTGGPGTRSVDRAVTLQAGVVNAGDDFVRNPSQLTANLVRRRVRMVQAELAKQGFRIAVDGIWGPQTEKAWQSHIEQLTPPYMLDVAQGAALNAFVGANAPQPPELPEKIGTPEQELKRYGFQGAQQRQRAQVDLQNELQRAVGMVAKPGVRPNLAGEVAQFLMPGGVAETVTGTLGVNRQLGLGAPPVNAFTRTVGDTATALLGIPIFIGGGIYYLGQDIAKLNKAWIGRGEMPGPGEFDIYKKLLKPFGMHFWDTYSDAEAARQWMDEHPVLALADLAIVAAPTSRLIDIGINMRRFGVLSPSMDDFSRAGLLKAAVRESYHPSSERALHLASGTQAEGIDIPLPVARHPLGRMLEDLYDYISRQSPGARVIGEQARAQKQYYKVSVAQAKEQTLALGGPQRAKVEALPEAARTRLFWEAAVPEGYRGDQYLRDQISQHRQMLKEPIVWDEYTPSPGVVRALAEVDRLTRQHETMVGQLHDLIRGEKLKPLQKQAASARQKLFNARRLGEDTTELERQVRSVQARIDAIEGGRPEPVEWPGREPLRESLTAKFSPEYAEASLQAIDSIAREQAPDNPAAWLERHQIRIGGEVPPGYTEAFPGRTMYQEGPRPGSEEWFEALTWEDVEALHPEIAPIRGVDTYGFGDWERNTSPYAWNAPGEPHRPYEPGEWLKMMYANGELEKPNWVVDFTDVEGRRAGLHTDLVEGTPNTMQEAPPPGPRYEQGSFLEEFTSQPQILDEARWERLGGDYQGDSQPIFFSKLRRTVESMKGEKAGVDELKAIFKREGVKEDELVWSGILDWLDLLKASSKKSVTKADVLAYLDEHGVRIYEIVKKPEEQLTPAESELQGSEVRYGEANYSILGGSEHEGYRELVLQLPPELYGQLHSGHYEPNALVHIRFFEDGDALVIDEIQSDWHQQGRRRGYKKPKAERDREAAPIEAAFERLNQRWQALEQESGMSLGDAEAAVLRWHTLIEDARAPGQWYAKYDPYYRRWTLEKGRRAPDGSVYVGERPRAYYTDGATPDRFPDQTQALGAAEQLNRRDAETLANIDAVEMEYGEAQRIHERFKELENHRGDLNRQLREIEGPEGVEAAPFQHSWEALALKRMLRWAVDNGYTVVEWPHGYVHAYRWHQVTESRPTEYYEGYDSFSWDPRELLDEDVLAEMEARGEAVEPVDISWEFRGEPTEDVAYSSDSWTGFLSVEEDGSRVFYGDVERLARAQDPTRRAEFEALQEKPYFDELKDEIEQRSELQQDEEYTGDVELSSEGQGTATFYDEILPRTAEKIPALKVTKTKMAPGYHTREGMVNEPREDVYDDYFDRQEISMHRIEITPEAAAIIRQPQPLFQGPRDRPRGVTQVLGNDRFLMQVFNSGNPSTLFHELGHSLLWDLSEGELRTVSAHLFEGRRLEDMTIADHEAWGKTVERYFYEGKAPKPIRAIVEKIAEWMRRVYQAVTEIGAVEIHPDVRAVLDRVLGGNISEADRIRFAGTHGASVERVGGALSVAKDKLQRLQKADMTRQVNRSLPGLYDQKARLERELAKAKDPDYIATLEEELADLDTRISRIEAVREATSKRREQNLQKQIAGLEKALTYKPDEKYARAMESLRWFTDDTMQIMSEVFGPDWVAEIGEPRLGLMTQELYGVGDRTDVFMPHRMVEERRTLRHPRLGQQKAIGKANAAALRAHQRNELILYHRGDLLTDPDVLFQHWVRAQAFRYALDVREVLGRVAEPIDVGTGPKPGYWLFNPKGQTKPTWWRAAAGGDEAAFYEGMQGFLRSFLGKEGDDAALRNLETGQYYPDVKQIAPEAIETLAARLPGAEPRSSGIGTGFDVFAGLAKASLLYANPGYIPANFVGNMIFLGLYAPLGGIRGMFDAGKMLLFERDQALIWQILAEVGEGPTASLMTDVSVQTASGRIARGLLRNERALAQFIGRFSDAGPRAAAWMTAARKHGYETPEQWAELLGARAPRSHAYLEIQPRPGGELDALYGARLRALPNNVHMRVVQLALDEAVPKIAEYSGVKIERAVPGLGAYEHVVTPYGRIGVNGNPESIVNFARDLADSFDQKSVLVDEVGAEYLQALEIRHPRLRLSQNQRMKLYLELDRDPRVHGYNELPGGGIQILFTEHVDPASIAALVDEVMLSLHLKNAVVHIDNKAGEFVAQSRTQGESEGHAGLGEEALQVGDEDRGLVRRGEADYAAGPVDSLRQAAVDAVESALRRADKGELGSLEPRTHAEKLVRDRMQVSYEATEAMVNFGRLSPFEKRYIQRIIFVWPWIRGATAWVAYYGKQYPERAAALATAGYKAQKQAEETLGPVPSYYDLMPLWRKGDIANVVNLGPISPTLTAVQLGRTLGGFARSVGTNEPMPKYMTVWDMVNPVIDLFVSVMMGRGQYGETKGIQSIAETWAFGPTGVGGILPGVQFVRQMIDPSDEASSAWLETGRWAEIKRRVIRVMPMLINAKKLNEIATIKPKETPQTREEAWLKDVQKWLGYENIQLPQEARRQRHNKLLYELAADELQTQIKENQGWQAPEGKRVPTLTPRQRVAIKLAILERVYPGQAAEAEQAKQALPNLPPGDSTTPGTVLYLETQLNARLFGMVEKVETAVTKIKRKQRNKAWLEKHPEYAGAR